MAQKTIQMIRLCLLFLLLAAGSAWAQPYRWPDGHYSGTPEQNQILESEFWNPNYLIADVYVDSVVNLFDSSGYHRIAYCRVNDWLRGQGPIRIEMPLPGEAQRYRKPDGTYTPRHKAHSKIRLNSKRLVIAVEPKNGLLKFRSNFAIIPKDRLPKYTSSRITFKAEKGKGFGLYSELELFRYLKKRLSISEDTIAKYRLDRIAIRAK